MKRVEKNNRSRLWAPWRLEYILSEKTNACFLCDIFAEQDDRKNLILKRGQSCAVIFNRYPYNNGHLLIAPYRHIADFSDLNSNERLEIMDLTAAMTALLKKHMRPQGFNIGINVGSIAGAGLKDHIHLHIVPRWTGDTNFMAVIGDTNIIPQALDDLWQQLRAAL